MRLEDRENGGKVFRFIGLRGAKRILRNSVFVLLLSGCASQAYDGPKRPVGKVCKVYFYSSKPVSFSSMAVDGRRQGVFDAGIEVLPGSHNVSAEFEIKQEDCDGDGCALRTFSGKCDATIRTEAGQTYAVRARGVTDTAFVTLLNEGSGEVAGSGTCLTQNSTYNYRPAKR